MLLVNIALRLSRGIPRSRECKIPSWSLARAQSSAEGSTQSNEGNLGLAPAMLLEAYLGDF